MEENYQAIVARYRQSNNERAERLRKRREQQGMKQVAMWLSAATLEKIEALRQGAEPLASVVTRAVELAYAGGSGSESLPTLRELALSPVEMAYVGEAASERENVVENVISHTDMDAVLAKIRALRKQGFGKVRIAQQLTAAGFLTVTGKKEWHPNTVWKLLKKHGL